MLHSFNRALELPDRIETEYLRALCYDFPRQYSDTYKTYEYARLCTILEGEKTISANQGDQIRYGSSQFLLMPPGSKIDMTINVPTKALVFELNDSLIKRVSENISVNYDVDYDTLIQDRFLCSTISPELQEVLGKMNKTLESRAKGIEYILDLYAQELACNLVQIKSVNQILNFEPDNPVNRAIRYMKKEYRSPVSIKQIAYMVEMSEANFCQYFKRVTGISPKEYLTHIKMEKAREIIAHESITDAAYDLGYENISHFISTFKEEYGVTPKQYKKKCI